MKVTFRRLRINIINSLMDKGWSSRWTEDFVNKKDSQILLKQALKCLANGYKKGDMIKFMNKFKDKKKKRYVKN
jgi:hypothetical protein